MLNRYGWVLALLGIVVLSSVQIWSAASTKRQTAELHALLADTQAQSLQLTREIGYGGLIHNFKNLVLRSDDKTYYTDGVASAVSAFTLVSQLESNAVLLEVTAELSNTRKMISAYRTRLDRVIELHNIGMSVTEVDDAVRFNDDSALLEITTLLDNLSNAVDYRVERIRTRDSLYSNIIIIGNVLLGGLAIGILLNHRRKAATPEPR